MQLSKFLVAAGAFAVASAKVIITNLSFQGITVNVPFNVTWSDATGPVTLKLRTNNNAVDVMTIYTGLTGTSYQWIPSPTIPNGKYNLEIDSGSDINYSVEFDIFNPTSVTASSTGAATVSSTDAVTASMNTVTDTSASTAAAVSRTVSSVLTSATASISSNRTVSASRSSSSPAKTSSPKASSSPVPTSGSVAQYASHFALVLLAFAAIITLN